MKFQGAVIARERLCRGWSQDGVCRGICAVSYLSKIESGRADASEEVLRLLLGRLGIEWSAELENEARALAENGYEALFSASYDELSEIVGQSDVDKYRAAASGIEIELLYNFVSQKREPLASEMEKFMDSRALALQRILQGRFDEALCLAPNAYVYYESGVSAYSRGDYIRATEHLQTAYEAASKDGRAKLMLLCKLFLGSCCANRRDRAGMEGHYVAARRLAAAMGNTEAIENMAYNSAATAIECGEYEEAYAYFSNLDEPEMMSLHKLAIACEMTGRREEAIAALDRAEKMESVYPDSSLAKEMCALVRIRVEDTEYLKCDAYGEKLLAVFDRCRHELSAGYAYFHHPWVIEWYKAGRQYKKALELMEDFPSSSV